METGALPIVLLPFVPLTCWFTNHLRYPCMCAMMSAMTTTLKTRTKAPYVIVYVGPKGVEIAGYAYTLERAKLRARRLGFRYVVRPVEAGHVTVELP